MSVQTLRNALLNGHARQVKLVSIPSVEEPIYVQSLTAGERDRFEREHVASDEQDFRARLAAYSACDSEGTPLFGPADVASLSRLPAYVLDPIVKAAIELNRFTSGDIEDLRKNS